MVLSVFNTVPAKEEVPCEFAAQLASEELRHPTTKSYMAGVCRLHIGEGLEDSTCSGVEGASDQ